MDRLGLKAIHPRPKSVQILDTFYRRKLMDTILPPFPMHKPAPIRVRTTRARIHGAAPNRSLEKRTVHSSRNRLIRGSHPQNSTRQWASQPITNRPAAIDHRRHPHTYSISSPNPTSIRAPSPSTPGSGSTSCQSSRSSGAPISSLPGQHILE